jgi:hypothetical protein
MTEVSDNLRRARERMAAGVEAPTAGDGSGGHTGLAGGGEAGSGGDD